MKFRMQIAGLVLLVSAGFCARAQEPLPPPPPDLLPAQTAAPAQSAVPAGIADAASQAVAAVPAAPASGAAQPGDPQLKQDPLELLRNFEPSADEEYTLGRGDEIAVDFAGRPEMKANLTIGPDGRITLPLAGDIMLAGLTRPQSADAIQKALAPYYDNLMVQVAVTRYTSNRVLVLGAVTKPGQYAFAGTPTLLGALTQAGMEATGPDKVAQIPEECAIYRGSQQVVWVQLKKLIESGNTLADLRLRRNDVIYVPNMAERFVSVLGAVMHPGAVQLTSNATIGSVLASSGGLAEAAGNNPHIQIVNSTTGTSRVFRFRDILNPAKSNEIVLRPGDIVFVPKSGFDKATYVMQRLSPIFALSSLAYLGAFL